MNKKGALIAIIAAAIAVPAIVYAASPLFINTTINEPLPTTTETMTKDESITDDDGAMMEEKDDAMTKGEETTMSESPKPLSGSFVGAGDGIHNAQGVAKVIYLDDGSSVLRLEDFKATNGPDLYVYLSTDKGASEYVDLGRLKANNGNQNYDIPAETDLSKYDTVLVWCKAFSVLFGSSELAAAAA